MKREKFPNWEILFRIVSNRPVISFSGEPRESPLETTPVIYLPIKASNTKKNQETTRKKLQKRQLQLGISRRRTHGPKGEDGYKRREGARGLEDDFSLLVLSIFLKKNKIIIIVILVFQSFPLLIFESRIRRKVKFF